MSYNSQTQKYDVFATIPSKGIKVAKKSYIASFDTIAEANAGNIVAEKMLQLFETRIPSHREINNWISNQLSFPEK